MIIGAYQHLGLPRFQSPEDALTAVDRASITRAMVCSFETCPDLAAVHHAFTSAPDRFPGLGIPIGRDPQEVETVVRLSCRPGLRGYACPGVTCANHPGCWIRSAAPTTSPLPAAAATVWPTGRGHLLHFLERHPRALAIGGHFAGLRRTQLSLVRTRPRRTPSPTSTSG